MKNNIKNSLRALLLVPVLAFAFGTLVPAVSVGAQLGISEGADAAQGDDQDENAGCLFAGSEGCEGEDGIFKTVTNVLLFIIGAVAVIMLVIGGIRYTISGGDSAQIKAAKDTILYAIVGIVVAILAYAAVNFVIGEFVGGS